MLRVNYCCCLCNVFLNFLGGGGGGGGEGVPTYIRAPSTVSRTKMLIVATPPPPPPYFLHSSLSWLLGREGGGGEGRKGGRRGEEGRGGGGTSPTVYQAIFKLSHRENQEHNSKCNGQEWHRRRRYTRRDNFSLH